MAGSEEVRTLGPFGVAVEWPAPPNPDLPRPGARPQPAPVIAPRLSLAGERLVAVLGGQRVQVWDVGSGRELVSFQGSSLILGLGVTVCSPDGRYLAATRSTAQGQAPREVQVWDGATGQELLTLRGHLRGVTGLAFSPDSRRLISTGQDGTVRLWELTTGLELITLPVPGVHQIESPWLAFSADGNRVLLAGASGVIHAWDGTR
jgi:WD40 repeat protein